MLLTALDKATQDNTTSSFAVFGQLFFLILMFALVLFLAYFVTKIIAGQGRGKRGNNLEIIETMSLGPQVAIQLVRAGAKFVLLGITKETISFLAEIDPSMIDLSQGMDKPMKELFVAEYLEKFNKNRHEKDKEAGKKEDIKEVIEQLNKNQRDELFSDNKPEAKNIKQESTHAKIRGKGEHREREIRDRLSKGLGTDYPMSQRQKEDKGSQYNE